jgi:hypothetical protein
LAGCSIEDWDGEAIYDVGLATERVAAAATEFRDHGMFGYLDRAGVGATWVRSSFGPH